jgi:hypothetical protein
VTRWTLLALAALAPRLSAQQLADSAFALPIARPAFAEGAGPVVAVDAAHHNFHTPAGRYLAFARLLGRDGFVVRTLGQPWTAASLAGVRVLVVANALHASNVESWSLPTPSAFSDAEISTVHQWVVEGGSLLLIADHMPFAGAADRLAISFGVQYANGFAYDADWDDPQVFRRADGSLGDHAITRGRGPAERVDSVATFAGSAFRPPERAKSLLGFGPGAFTVKPDTAWRFDSTTARVPIEGWSQGAVLQLGQGRIAVFGEAAMFSAQVAGPTRRPMGMNAPVAAQNPQFLLNLLHWLAGILK